MSHVYLRGDRSKPMGDYSCSPREAVMAAYAQNHKGDWNTWTYEKAYGHLVRTGPTTVSCGPFTCRLEEE